MTNFGTISSIRNYVKKLDSKFQAQQRSEGKTEKQSNLDKWIKEQKDKAKNALKTLQDMEENTDHELNTIQSKVYSGATLSREEREYLKTKNPVLYARLEAADLEKKAYERELKRCRTKDEVQRLKVSHVASSLSAINSAYNNPIITTAQKLAIAQGEMYKMKGIQEVTAKFIKTGAYHNLPTEQEKAIAEKRVKQTEECRQQKISQDRLETIYGKEESEETVEQAENSPEMLKFKRAKARRGYAASTTEPFVGLINQKN